MAGISKYTRVVLLLAAGFVLYCGGWFGHQLSMSTPCQVSTVRQPTERDYGGTEDAAGSSGEASRPDSLLPGEVIDLNTADFYDLQRLPGIGEKRALDIIAYREEHGPFRTVDDLVSISGIGPGILEGLREYADVK